VANEKIKEWANETPGKLVIGLDGYSGVGKTTLLNHLTALNPDILAVNRDDFLFSRQSTNEKLSETEDRSVIWELQVTDDEKMGKLVAVFRDSASGIHKVNTYNPISGEIDIPKQYDLSKKIMVVEGVFMFHSKLPMSNFWDKKIYLDGDIEKIDERRVKREKEKWGDKYFPETHPDSHLRAIKIALQRYFETYKPLEQADLVLKID
jgi:uridine kinase